MTSIKYVMNVNWRMAYDAHVMRFRRIILTNSMQFGHFSLIHFLHVIQTHKPYVSNQLFSPDHLEVY